MLPPVAFQVTAPLGPPNPETVAPNVVDSPAFRLMVDGLTLTPLTTEFTVTLVLALLLGSTTLAAVTMKVPAAVAVNTPFPSMLPPPLTDQLMPAFIAPYTVAANRRVPPAFTAPFVGVGVLTEMGPTVTVAEPALLPFWTLVAVTV
ncbi:hypothetical protein [Geothrix sp. 21YS21S-4]|uniref:hypothetical protein n=1 Tax=Geothrix sp. 21YS21S-4 TaxID=3068889 RepID=UPI0027BAC73C|nr:hypothetical protein [Geothrix sp. 21YS21S-4]